MTKKFIHSDELIEGQPVKEEHLIPDIFTKTNYFLGIESFEKYERGLIVYTGTELSVSKVLDRLRKKKSLSLIKRLRARVILKKYLSQIKQLKVGDNVNFSSFNELNKIKRGKPRTYKD